MPYNPNFTPDAPLPISMLPDAEPLTRDNLLLVTQPANAQGRSRKVSIQSLLNSDPFVQAPSGLVSNVVQFTGALPQCTYAAASSLLVASLDVPVVYDVDFRVWGTSGTASVIGATSSYEYGLTAITRMTYGPEDVDHDEAHSLHVGRRVEVGGSTIDLTAPIHYSGLFPVSPFAYSPTASELEAHPTKQVKLYLSSGTSTSPYQATRPSSFSLKIQAVLRPAKYAANLLTLA